MAQSSETWYLVTDKGQEIALTEDVALVQSWKGLRNFSIAKKDADGTYRDYVARNVRKVTFLKKALTGIGGVEEAGKVQLLFQENRLTVTHLQASETISLFSAAGVKIAQAQADAQGTANISTLGMPAGVYVLKTIYTNITFIKK